MKGSKHYKERMEARKKWKGIWDEKFRHWMDKIDYEMELQEQQKINNKMRKTIQYGTIIVGLAIIIVLII